MSWEIFRCETNCTAKPDACINAELYTQMSTALAHGGYLEAGYKTVSIDDCWEANDPGAKNASFEPFLCRHDHFTKTGSGQT